MTVVLAQLPFAFEWAAYEFMRNALVAVLLAAPLFALLGTLVVSNRMAFFSEAIGHASLAGLGLGVLLGLGDPLPAMVGFCVVLGVAVLTLQRATRAPMDTVISLSMSFSVAAGVVILARGGGFNRYTDYLVGDLLGIGPRELLGLLLATVLVGGGVLAFYNRILLVGLSDSLARSRGSGIWWTQVLFVTALAMVVTMNLGWVGLLLVNSLLVLPAAAARNVAGSVRGYVGWAAVFALVAGVGGLIASYYLDTASGATIVLACIVLYAVTLAVRIARRGA